MGKRTGHGACRACVDWGLTCSAWSASSPLVLPDNLASVRVLEKLGFTHEQDVEEDRATARLYALHQDRLASSLQSGSRSASFDITSGPSWFRSPSASSGSSAGRCLRAGGQLVVGDVQQGEAGELAPGFPAAP